MLHLRVSYTPQHLRNCCCMFLYCSQQSKAQRHGRVPSEEVVHSHSISPQSGACTHAGSLRKSTMDASHMSDEGDKTRAWMVSVLKPLADFPSPSILPEVSLTGTQQEPVVPHVHTFVECTSRGAGVQMEMKRTRNATSTAVPHISEQQTSSFSVLPRSTGHHLVNDTVVGKAPAPFMTAFGEQAENSALHDPTWRPLTGRKLEVRLDAHYHSQSMKDALLTHHAPLLTSTLV